MECVSWNRACGLLPHEWGESIAGMCVLYLRIQPRSQSFQSCSEDVISDSSSADVTTPWALIWLFLQSVICLAL